MPFGAPPLPPNDPDATVFIPRVGGVPASSKWPVADPDSMRPYDSLATRMLPRLPSASQGSFGEGPGLDATGYLPKVEKPAAAAPSLVKSSSRIAVASLISRITGFFWKIMLVWAVGTGIVNDSFNIANTLPNIVFELLLGGVLSSVVVPLLVRSQDDPDGGEAYTQRMLTVASVLLLFGTIVAVIAAPAFTSLYTDGGSGEASPELTTAFARLLLPEILFYGLFALLSAVLNAKQIFGPAAWAPVVNNLVVIVTLGLFMVLPGEISTNPVRMGDTKLLVLGVGVTMGIVVQAIMLVPPLLRTGFRFKWRWGLDARMREFGGLALWILGYVGVSQIGFTINTRVLTSGDAGGVTIYSNAWLLFQLPYGVIGVSLLTAIMPRLSRNAADGDTRKVVADLSYASRISTVMLVPIAAVMSVIGSSVGIALFSGGANSSVQAERLGEALAISAFGLLPYALVMLQLRVFYAMKDARTPTLIMIVMTIVKIPLLYLCQALLSDQNIVLGAMMVNSLTFVVGAIMGQVWLWVSLGNLRSKRVLGVILFTVVASALGVVAAVLVGGIVPDFGVRITAWLKLILQGIVGLGVSFGVLAALKVEELAPATKRITRLVKRR
ncbi:murein biosynthesis integral membrane protein MurJ [Amycolatopsis acidiphila]|uniref:Murein biosynthesis integral membrane protein MurJ n=1 Tax=Amycolatopsis acidiphila TaxID=715473 RepID=A0A558A2D5_9PSEU|nr:murein biosynthesis integral membrane protein MurJ [Amycolatopsis acidiphila]TVT18424.1 murein biosynthesis integral membrane protein MurJ [Amycolatopsis acidiphila]UIJ64147.1 murein biosynthesis integral membrane protein MurJ [Amycolatopsis acidiphila]GHG61276.1 lipid II flippase MurJ [Amycolatopsis acidiphila]